MKLIRIGRHIDAALSPAFPTPVTRFNSCRFAQRNLRENRVRYRRVAAGDELAAGSALGDDTPHVVRER
jgi:hypothetical protein